eukprot:11176216-Lingulodinium_polyedra.AAC.1
MECARVRFVSRSGGRRLIRPHHCAAFYRRYTMMRSNRPCAAAPVCKSSHGVRACDFRAVVAPDGRFDRIFVHRF